MGVLACIKTYKNHWWEIVLAGIFFMLCARPLRSLGDSEARLQPPPKDCQWWNLVKWRAMDTTWHHTNILQPFNYCVWNRMPIWIEKNWIYFLQFSSCSGMLVLSQAFFGGWYSWSILIHSHRSQLQLVQVSETCRGGEQLQQLDSR